MKEDIKNTDELVVGDEEVTLRLAIGRQIRHSRKEKGLTVSELSVSSSVSPAMISKIENGQTSASLATLQRIAKSLGTSLSSFFAQFEEHHGLSYVKAGEGLEISRRGTRSGHHYLLLGHGVRTEVTVEPYLIALTNESEVFPWFQHNGVEFIYMLEGKMLYRHGDSTYTLAPGDSLFFDPKPIHGPAKLIEFPIRFLSIISTTGSS